MNTFQLIIRTFSMLPDYYHNHMLSCWIVLGLNLLGLLAGFINTFRRGRALKAPVSFVYIILRLLLLSGSLIFGFMLLLASEVAEAAPEHFNIGFYLEVIIASAIMLVILYRKVNEEDPSDGETGTAESFIIAAVVVILSVIFMIFGNGVCRWGFSLFGKKIGGWFFGLYAGWAVGIIFDLLRELTDMLVYFLGDSLDSLPAKRKPDPAIHAGGTKQTGGTKQAGGTKQTGGTSMASGGVKESGYGKKPHSRNSKYVWYKDKEYVKELLQGLALFIILLIMIAIIIRGSFFVVSLFL